MATPFGDLTDAQIQRRRVREAVGRGERNGDHDHADVHDHAAVGATDETPPSLAAGGEGSDLFVFGGDPDNGISERFLITDYEVGIDAISLGGAELAGAVNGGRAHQIADLLDRGRDGLW